DVQAGGDSGQGGGGQVVVEAVGLVGGKGVHGVEQDRLDTTFALGLGAAAVVQDRDEEGLGLSGTGAGGDEGGFGGLVQGGQALEGLRLVQEGRETGWVPFQGRAPGVVGFAEGRADPQVGAPEDALGGVVEERFQAFTDGFVGECEGRGEVLGDVAAYLGS